MNIPVNGLVGVVIDRDTAVLEVVEKDGMRITGPRIALTLSFMGLRMGMFCFEMRIPFEGSRPVV